MQIKAIWWLCVNELPSLRLETSLHRCISVLNLEVQGISNVLTHRNRKLFISLQVVVVTKFTFWKFYFSIWAKLENIYLPALRSKAIFAKTVSKL